MKDLLQLMWVAPVVAVAVTASFSFCVVGLTRAADARRAGNGRAATAWGIVAAVAAAVVVAQIVAGVGVIVAG